MQFAGMSYLAVVVAAIAGFGFGAAWYTILGKQWMAALGKSEAELKANGGPMPFVIAAVAQLVMSFVLAGVIGHLGEG